MRRYPRENPLQNRLCTVSARVVCRDTAGDGARGFCGVKAFLIERSWSSCVFNGNFMRNWCPFEIWCAGRMLAGLVVSFVVTDVWRRIKLYARICARGVALRKNFQQVLRL